jgi:hypothetical protein
VTALHRTRVAPLTVSMGDPIQVYPGSARLAVVCQEALVLGELEQEISEVSMPWA